MAIRTVTADDAGAIYAITTEGDLLFYRDEARDGTPRFQDGGVAHAIGSGWGELTHVFCGGDGIIYAVAPDGSLLFYRDLAQDGTANWANGGQAAVIGSGWDAFTKVVSGGDGVIYGVTAAGHILFYKDTARDGTASWASGSGQRIATGWDGYKQVIGGGDGVLYAVDPDGRLLFFQDLARDGTEAWANGGVGQQIGDGWANFVTVVSGGQGRFYAITPDGFLMFYRDLARDGTSDWALGGAPATLGSGWQPGAAKPVTIEGYAYPLSAAPGGTVKFMVSSHAPFDVTYLRLKEQPNGDLGEALLGPIAQAGGPQPMPATAWEGAGWAPTFSLKVPAGWPSGPYAAHCVEAGGNETYIVFIVTPKPANRARIALLANAITWSAYNDWGGRSKYTTPPGAMLSFERPHPQITPVNTGVLDHLLRAELWIHGWLEDAGYAVDVYTDVDFHKKTGWEHYSAIIFSTHPEYWTKKMMDRLESYVAQGGSALYLGGNGVFEQVELPGAGKAARMLGGDPAAARDQFYFRNLQPPRPERATLGVAYRYDNYLTFAPYEVLQAGHRFFAGTGLANGDLIGAAGRNGGGASGWEMDTSEPGMAPDGAIVAADGADDRGAPPANLVVLARGTNPGFGADMTVYDTPAGGVVFSVGSISFGGSLVDDPGLQQILKNVLDECIA
jgi:N,N-dimethylformamidase